MTESIIIREQVVPYLWRLGLEHIETEVEIKLGSKMLHVDIVGYRSTNKQDPYVVVEVKQHLSQEITLLDTAVQQAFTMATALGDPVKYILITDGVKHSWFERDAQNQSLIKLKYPPTRLVNSPKPQERAIKQEAIENSTRYLRLLQTLANLLRDEGLTFDIRMGIELNQILIAKLYDERNSSPTHTPLFHADSHNAETVYKQVKDLYNQAVNEWDMGSNLAIVWTISPETTFKIVRLLEPYFISTVSHSVRARTFWLLFSNLLRSDGGEYTTPEYLAELMINIARPQYGERVIDPACGTGLLLLEAVRYVENNQVMQGSGTSDEYNTLIETKAIEINSEVARLALTNFMLNQLHPGHVINANSLMFVERSNEQIRLSDYDLVLLDPPIGGYIQASSMLRAFELARDKIRVNRELLFVELTVRLLRPHGRGVLLVPDNFKVDPNVKTVGG